MCKIQRICFVPAFSLPYAISQGKQDSLLLFRKYLLKWQEKHLTSEKIPIEKSNSNTKISAFSTKRYFKCRKCTHTISITKYLSVIKASGLLKIPTLQNKD